MSQYEQDDKDLYINNDKDYPMTSFFSLNRNRCGFNVNGFKKGSSKYTHRRNYSTSNGGAAECKKRTVKYR
jgi:hypothetical protein